MGGLYDSVGPNSNAHSSSDLNASQYISSQKQGTRTKALRIDLNTSFVLTQGAYKTGHLLLTLSISLPPFHTLKHEDLTLNKLAESLIAQTSNTNSLTTVWGRGIGSNFFV